MKTFLSIILLLLCFSSFGQKKVYLLAGTYTKGKSTGIYVYDFNTQTGTATIVDSVKTSNPSYLEVAPNKQFVYAVNENGEKGGVGKVSAFSFDKQTGHLSLLNQQLSKGDYPCYITIDKTGKWVLVGNYGNGTAAVFPVEKEGSLGESVSLIQHKGSGPDKQRQEGPHVHATVLSPDNRYLFVPDLGIDKIMIYAFNSGTGKLVPAKDTAMKLTGGSGPRHFIFHPNGRWAYVVQEMGGTVTAFTYKNGSLKTFQTLKTVPASFTKPFTGADIHITPDGRFLYTSNRDSANTIAIFKIDNQTGKLSWVGQQPTMGRTPRNFNFDPTGHYLLVANQNSDAIVIFKRDIQTGLLHDTGHRINVGNPVCIKWIE